MEENSVKTKEYTHPHSLSFIIRIIAVNLFWTAPTIYFLLYMTRDISLYPLVLIFFFSLILTRVYLLYEDQVETGAKDSQGHKNPFYMIYDKEEKVKIGKWITKNLHQLVIIGFLTLTLFAMWNGINNLFFHDFWYTYLFISFFSLLIVGALYWSLSKIINAGKNPKESRMSKFIMLYLLFDFLPLCFNFLYFYDNNYMSDWRDNTIKVSQALTDRLTPNIKQKIKETGDALSRINNQRRESEDEIAKLKKERDSIDCLIFPESRKQDPNTELLNDWRRDRTGLNDRISLLERNKQKDSDAISNLDSWERLWRMDSALVTEIDEFWLSTKSEKKYNILKIKNDALKLSGVYTALPVNPGSHETVLSIIEQQVLKSDYQTPLEAINKLIDFLSSPFAKTASAAKPLQVEKIMINQEDLQMYDNFIAEKKHASSRVIGISLANSIYIDLLPLTLSIFCSMPSRRKKNIFKSV